MKKHHYSLTFYEVVAGVATHASIFGRYENPYVTLADIEAGRKVAGVGPRAALMACSYLGHMTEAEFVAGT